MAYSITQFQNAVGTEPLSALDNNFTTLGAADTIACGIAGTNALTLTPNAAGVVPSLPIAAYTNYMLFVGVASGTNTGPVTASAGTIGFLNVYKDGPAGPVLLTGGEIQQNNAVSLRYDSTLNAGAGGFHAIFTTQVPGAAITPSSVQVNGNSTLTNLLSGTVSVTFTVAPGWSSQDQAFSITAALASALPAVGDFMLVNPPSVAGPGISYAGYVSTVASLSSVASVATVNIRQINSASASLASNSGIYRYAAIRTVP
jgi:hypothetical protein